MAADNSARLSYAPPGLDCGSAYDDKMIDNKMILSLPDAAIILPRHHFVMSSSHWRFFPGLPLGLRLVPRARNRAFVGNFVERVGHLRAFRQSSDLTKGSL